MASSISALSDSELRDELLAFGLNVGPITGTTRLVYEKQLMRKKAELKSSPNRANQPKRVSSKSPGRPTLKDMLIVDSEKKKRAFAPKTSTPRNELDTQPVGDANFSNAFADEEFSYKTRRSSKLSGNVRTPSPIKSVANEPHSIIYPGLSNTTPIDDSAFKNKPLDKPPTPPRSTFLRRPLISSTPTSSLTASSNYQKIKHTKNFENESKKAWSRNGFEQRDDQSDDDHMESSRIIPRARVENPAPKISSTYFPVPRPSRSWWSSIMGSIPQSQVTHTRQNNADRRFPSHSSSTNRLVPSGSDISRLLLLSLSALFAFLLIAYLLTVHAGFLMQTAKLAYSASCDTALFLYTYTLKPTLIIAAVIASLTGIYILRQYKVKKEKEENQLVCDLIEKIIDIVRNASDQGTSYVAEPHVRDMLISPAKRMHGSPEWRRWQEAVKFLNLNESRVSTETRLINGVECAVWRWVPAKKTGWQGNAFDRKMRVNLPDQAPSRCLKLRGMFPTTYAEEGRDVNLAKALMQKIAPVEPLHIHVDYYSKDGLVFVRFATFADCGSAFKALHGTWFNGHLVSAKFLRDERYEQRFPDAPRR